MFTVVAACQSVVTNCITLTHKIWDAMSSLSWRCFVASCSRRFCTADTEFQLRAQVAPSQCRVRCSQVKAKAVSKYVDRIVTLAKRGDKHAFNQAVAYVYKRSVVQKAFDLLPTFYRHRHGGYTRVIPPHERGGRVRRRGDSAEMAYLELTPGMVDEDELEELLDESDEDVELEDGELPLDLRKPYLQFCIDMVKGNMPDQNAWDIASRDFRPDLLYRWLRDPRMTDEQRDTFLKKLDTAINTNNPPHPKRVAEVSAHPQSG